MGLTVGGHQGYNRLIGFGQDLLSNAYTIPIYLGFIAILVVLGVPEVEALTKKISSEFDANSAREITDVVSEIANKIRLYLGITTLTSVLTGIACGLWAAIWGLDLAVFWGVLTFLFELHPSSGNFYRHHTAYLVRFDPVPDMDHASRDFRRA